jgi:hypothetical protein
MSQWMYKGQAFETPGEYYGFVYLITNKSSGKSYIGKKFFWSKKRKIVKKKRKSFTVESDWKEYWSSSDELKADIERLGKDNFTREIIHLCKGKGVTNYYEAKEQFQREVLEKPDQWYNSWIQCKIHSSHITKWF